MSKKAIIAMSGGVDSSVAAYLMIQKGYECAGATMKLYDKPQSAAPGSRACCTPSDTEDARHVAGRLGILYYVSHAGRIPETCNPEIFRYLLRGRHPQSLY